MDFEQKYQKDPGMNRVKSLSDSTIVHVLLVLIKKDTEKRY